ncbi:MAG: arginine--tRNA ligase, partial [Syntrophomonas sp.]
MNPIEKLREILNKVIIDALEQGRGQGSINFDNIPDFSIEVPNDKGHGDFASNVAMLLAKQARMAPRQIAEVIVANAGNLPSQVEKVEVAGPGFINFFLNPAWLYTIPQLVLDMGERYGSNPQRNIRVQVEFVSANPTGNLHMGNARGGAIGDTLANILDRAGYDVEREFYINDAGNQIEIFGESLEARYLQFMGQYIQFPENGYAGQDVIDTVRNIIKEYKDTFIDMPSTERRQLMVDFALKEKLTYIKQTLQNF